MTVEGPAKFGPRRSDRWEAGAILLLSILAATVPFVFFAWRAFGDTKSDIEAERLRLAQVAAVQADRILTEALFEVELASALAPTRGEVEKSPVEAQPLRTLYGQAASFSAGVVFLNADGILVLAEPETAGTGLDRGTGAKAMRVATQSRDREVSEPFVWAATGHLVTALSVPVFGESGDRLGTMVGLLDLTEPLISDLVEPARLLGATGHADLVDERGLVLASTEPGHVSTAGDHPDFYQRMTITRAATVERVRHQPEGPHGDQSKWHIMAYAPLRNAPWGVAIGASEGETFRAVREFRRSLIILGIASIAVLSVGGALVVRRVPRTSL